MNESRETKQPATPQGQDEVEGHAYRRAVPEEIQQSDTEPEGE